MILLAILQRERRFWQELADPLSAISSIVVFFNMFLRLRANNRVIVISGAVVFDSNERDLAEFIRDLEHGKNVPLKQDLGHALCLANAHKCKARILMVSFEADRRIMRYLFCAQKMGVRIDAIPFSGDDFARQAAVMTGGAYWKGEKLERFFVRILGSRADVQPIGFRVRCVCHERDILCGLVCPICLSAYCQVVPACKRCKIRFEF